MSVEFVEGGEREPLRALIAGGGIAALEAMLALRSLAGERVVIELLAPEPEFVFQPLAVAEPFGFGEPTRISLPDAAAAAGATYRSDSLAAVEGDERRVITGGGETLDYDALLVATGARRVEAVPGALTYRGAADNRSFAALLSELRSRAVGSVAFAVPEEVRWPLALYELALLTSAHLDQNGIEAELVLVTPEPEPLGLFGGPASADVRRLLEGAGILLRTKALPVGFERGRLELSGAAAVEVDRVVALPRLEVPEIAGVPQGPRGFIGTDAEMRIEGLPRAYAAGDATWFPIKQGGIAAQQADVAARSIAALADAGVERAGAPFKPVLRAALLTADAPRYLRAAIGERDGTSVDSTETLWWPPGKVAGRHLAPYLAGEGSAAVAPLEDLEAPPGDDPEGAASDHAEAMELAFAAAEADARWRDYRGALRWLDIAEQLAIVLPGDYVEKRRRWGELAAADD